MPHLSKSLLLFSSLLLCACTGGGGEGGGGGGADAMGGGGDVEPASGAWDYSEYSAVSNTCNTDMIENQPSGGFALLNNDDGTFTVTPGDGTDPFDCTLSGSNYNCAEATAIDEDFNGAQVKGDGAVTGAFTNDSTATGTRTLDITCTGAGCATLEALGVSFPCELQVSFTATRQ